MALKLVNSWITTSIPGSYVNIEVLSSPIGASASGVVLIMGEADAGPSFSEEVLKNNFFSPDQADSVRSKYGSGPIVDAMFALASPSNSTKIQGSATRVFIVKTNLGAKAIGTLASYADLKAKKAGKDGNKTRYQVIASQTEVAPTKSGVAVPAFGATLNGTEFKIRLNGGAEATVTLSAVAGDHADIATLLVELNALLPVGVDAAAGAVANSVKLTVAADSAAWGKGWGKTIELIDSTPGDLAALGLTAGLTASSAEPAVDVQAIRTDLGTTESFNIKNEVMFEIGYAGTSGTVTITDTALTTTVVGGAGGNLSIDLTEFNTLSDLAEYINGQTGYSASFPASMTQKRPVELDDVSAIGICSTAAALKPGRIHRGAYNFINGVAQSTLIDAAPTAYQGIPTPMATAAFMSGGAKGGTTASDIVDAFAACEGIKANIIVPLISRDASLDIADGLTDASSTYTIDATNALAKSHCLKMSTPKMKRNRIAILSALDTFTNDISKAQSLANFRCSMAIQKITQTNSAGVVTDFQPWMAACIAAGMQSAGLYKSLVNKYANVIGFKDPVGYDSGSPGDVETALEGGLLILQQDTAGNKFVSDQTTYGFDTNFVYNSVQAVYLADIVALDLADSVEKAFVGESLADVNATLVASFIGTKMDAYRRQKLISASDDAPLGYKNLKVKINGPVCEISLEIKLSTSIYFAPINLSISQVQSAA